MAARLTVKTPLKRANAMKKAKPPIILTEEQVFKRAIKLFNKNKCDKIRPRKDNRFEVIDLNCCECGSQVFVSMPSMSKEDPNGFHWYCPRHGLVDEDGQPYDEADYQTESPPPPKKPTLH